MSQLNLSRVRLRAMRGEALSAVAPLLIPRSATQAPTRAHRVLWMLFQEIPDAERDFLWRDDGGGRYMILSPRPPSDPHGLFEIDTKPFAPELEEGDRLTFALRANPIIRIDQSETRTTHKGKSVPKRKKVDLVMHALRNVPKTMWDETSGRAKSGRAVERDQIATDATVEWLRQQGTRHGFSIRADTAVCSGYTQVPLERRASNPGSRPAGFSMIDIAGQLEVRDPGLFCEQLAKGFGSARAFGCGLMLIRRAV